MDILLINTLTIPSGEASVNRFLSFAKGLTIIGDRVTMLSSGRGDRVFHDYSGIKYINLNNRNIKSVGLMSSMLYMIKYITQNHIDVVHVTSSSPLLLFPLWLVCKINKVPYILEKSEYPFILMHNRFVSKTIGWLNVHILYKLFDGMVIMTDPLLRFYQPLVKKKCRFVKIPMTVDMTRFSDVRPNNLGEYAAYCGNMSGNKDGVENLIESFKYVKNSYPNLKLLLIGGTNNQAEFEHLKDMASECNVEFTGKVSREKIPQLLCNAKMLCLARPSSLQSSGGFPTKLGEYLSTGKPVIVTSVGDIPKYLNRENSFIVPPDDNKIFAEQVNIIMSDYDNALAIGARGKKAAQENFDISSQAQKLHQFYKSFIQ